MKHYHLVSITFIVKFETVKVHMVAITIKRKEIRRQNAGSRWTRVVLLFHSPVI